MREGGQMRGRRDRRRVGQRRDRRMKEGKEGGRERGRGRGMKKWRDEREWNRRREEVDRTVVYIHTFA